MVTFVPLLTAETVAALPERAQEVVEYRKSGLSLNHAQGCPLGCAYCIRHTYGLWDADTPAALVTDAEAVDQLVNHRYFKPHTTPLQIFNRSTDPFLAGVRDHLFAILEDLDARGLTNHVLVITRAVVRDADCARLNALKNLKLTLLFTYSGIEDRRVEPYPSSVAGASLRRATSYLDAAAQLPEAAHLKVLDITGRAVQVDGLASEQPRYFLQHAFAFQVHDAGHPHHLNRHGRADIGWEATTNG